MDFFTHILIGMLSGIVILKPFNLVTVPYIFFVGLMATFPDFDSFISPIAKKTNSYYLSHKAASHSYIIGIPISAIASWIFTIINSGHFWVNWGIGFAYFSLHVSLDAMTTSKLPAFYPITKKEFRLALDRAINPVLLIFSGYSTLFFAILILFSVDEELMIYFIIGWLVAYFIYFFVRILIKIIVSSELNSTQLYLPGVKPLSYLIYTKSDDQINTHFKLEMNYRKHGLQNIFDIEIKNDSIEMEFLKKALNVAKTYRFFSKWQAMIPLIRFQDKNIYIITLLGESYSKNRAYFVKTIFNVKTGELIKQFDGFNYAIHII